MKTGAIPAIGHFVWLGQDFPWLYSVAVRSAMKRGGFERIVLHHDGQVLDGNSRSEAFARLLEVEGVTASRIAVPSLCHRAGVAAAPIEDLLLRLRSPAARANVLRILILAAHGGVYLDTDTITQRPFREFIDEGGIFVGEERVVFPGLVARTRNPLVKGRSYLLAAFREVFNLFDAGAVAYTWIEKLYPVAVNNAVMGGPPQHRFWEELLSAMVAMPPQQQLKRFALGTHLLQEKVASYLGRDLRVLPPEVFFPIGPGLSKHWFRRRKDIRLPRSLASTVSVHWYASAAGADLDAIDSSYVKIHAENQWLSHLALPYC